MYILNFVNDVSNFFGDIKRWFLNNYDNPLLWLGIVLGVITIFGIAYSAIHGRD